MNKILSRALRGFILVCALVVGCQAEQRVIVINVSAAALPYGEPGYFDPLPPPNLVSVKALTSVGWRIVYMQVAGTGAQALWARQFTYVFVLESPPSPPSAPVIREAATGKLVEAQVK